MVHDWTWLKPMFKRLYVALPIPDTACSLLRVTCSNWFNSEIPVLRIMSPDEETQMAVVFGGAAFQWPSTSKNTMFWGKHHNLSTKVDLNPGLTLQWCYHPSSAHPAFRYRSAQLAGMKPWNRPLRGLALTSNRRTSVWRSSCAVWIFTMGYEAKNLDQHDSS